jgi:iodotyrosine deiodinase
MARPAEMAPPVNTPVTGAGAGSEAGSKTAGLSGPVFEALQGYPLCTDEDSLRWVEAFRQTMQSRRTVRHFSERPVPRALIEQALLAAGTAPSGANLQPWQFVVVTDPLVKQRLRQEAEREEREFYEHRAPQEWLEALAPLGTDADKPFLETAPVLIAIFGDKHSLSASGKRIKNYYVPESVGIATGLLIAALHHAGLATLTHTPSPMGFLNELLGVPRDSRPMILLVVGHPAPDCQVPRIGRKSLEQIARFV